MQAKNNELTQGSGTEQRKPRCINAIESNETKVCGNLKPAVAQEQEVGLNTMGEGIMST